MRTHNVSAGDTLNKIAQRYGTTVAAIARANNIANPDLIHSGATLVIPDGWDGTERRGTPRPASNTVVPGGGPVFTGRSAENAAKSWAPSGSTGQVQSTAQANAYHVTQWGPTAYNASGTQYGFSDCVPTSGVIALSRLGLIAPPTANGASGAIDALRDKAFGRNTTYSTPTGYGTIATGLAAYGATTRNLNHGDLSTIDAALERGNPVMAAGGPWAAWGAEQKAAGNYLNSKNPGPHSVTILGKTAQGGYIVADPLSSKSSIEVSADQLRRYFIDGASESGAMEVIRADGKRAPGVTGSPANPAPSSGPQSTSGTAGPQVELERGMYSDEVRQLQQVLVDMGFLTSAQMATGPGTFGPQTQAAVSALQDFLISQQLMTHEQKASGPGRYGPVTMGALRAYQARGGAPGTTAPTTPVTPGSSAVPAGSFPHLEGVSPPADNTSARYYWAKYVRDEVMPRLTALGVDPALIKSAAWFGLSEGIYTIANNTGYAQANGPQSPISFSNFADSHNWSSGQVNGRTAFPPGLPYNGYGWRSGNWQVGIAGAQVTDAIDSGSLVRAFKKIYGDVSPQALGQRMLELAGEGGRTFPASSIEQLATQQNQQWAAILLRDPMINVLVQTMNPAIKGPFGYGQDIVNSVFG